MGTTIRTTPSNPVGRTQTRLGVLVPVLPGAFPFRNGFADGGRQGEAAADGGRQQDLLVSAFVLVRIYFAW